MVSHPRAGGLGRRGLGRHGEQDPPLSPATGDPDGDHIVFFFDFGDGQTAQGPPCRQQNTYHRGRYTANMCVWDSRPEHSLECVAFAIDAR